MPKVSVRDVAFLLVLPGVFITTTILLTLLAGNPHSTTAACYAPTATEKRQGSETFQRLPSPTEYAIDI